MTQFHNDEDKLNALAAKAAISREITDKYWHQSLANDLAEKLCGIWVRVLHDRTLRATWLDWERATLSEREYFIAESIKQLSSAFDEGSLPVTFAEFVAGSTPAAEFSPDGFVFYGRQEGSVIIGQITHEFVHYLQSIAKSSVPITALLLAYMVYITPVRAAATNKTAEFIRRAYDSLIGKIPDTDRENVEQAYSVYQSEGQMFDNFGINPTDDHKKIISEIYRESIIEVEAAHIADYVRMKMADLLHIERMSLWN